MVVSMTRRRFSVSAACGPAEDGQQRADAEVEALEHEVAGPEQTDEAEPDECVVHELGPRRSVGELELGVLGRRRVVDQVLEGLAPRRT